MAHELEFIAISQPLPLNKPANQPVQPASKPAS